MAGNRALSLYSTWALIVINSLVFVGSGIIERADGKAPGEESGRAAN